MELDAVKAPVGVEHARDGAAGGGSHQLEAPGQVHHLVAMAHPDIQQGAAVVVIDMVLDIVQQGALSPHPDLGVAELLNAGRLHPAPEVLGHGLHAVTDTQHGDTELVDHGGNPGRAIAAGDGFRPAGQDNAAGLEGADGVIADIEGVDLGTPLPAPVGRSTACTGSQNRE